MNTLLRVCFVLQAENDQLKVEVHRLHAQVDRLTHELEELKGKQQQALLGDGRCVRGMRR